MRQEYNNIHPRLVYMCVWCLTASIPAFQAGGTSSNLATHSRLLVQNLKFAISVWIDNGGRAEPFYLEFA